MTHYTDEQIEKARAIFTEYFVKNYPGPDTIIGEPKWHAPRIFGAAFHALEAVAPEAGELERLRDENQRLREALQGLANALEVAPGPRGVMGLVPPALVRARAALKETGE